MTGTEVAENVLAAIRAYSDNPSAFLALNEGTASFTAPGIDGVVAYRRAGRYLIQLGGPFAPAAERAALLSAFTAFAAGRRQGVLAVQLQAEDAELYAANGFAVNQIGASYALDLSRFSLRGSKFMRLRNKISRARRSGLVVEEVAGDDPAGRATLDEIDRATVILVASLSPFGQGARRAIVVPGDLAYGLSRMFEMLRERSQDEIYVCRSLTEACTWLGLSQAQAWDTAQRPPDWASGEA